MADEAAVESVHGRIIKQVYASPGYNLDISLESDELDTVRDRIYDQWLYRLQIKSSQIANEITSVPIGMEKYHLLSDQIQHDKIWKKITRVLPPGFYKWFKDSRINQNLTDVFGDYQVSDEENLGWPNFYWRLTRPKASSDVGPIHRDSWFWQLNPNFPKPSHSFHRVKVWIPIYVEVGKNGLLVEDDSHLREDIDWNGEERDGILKPVLMTSSKNINLRLLKANCGNLVIFNDDLLHGGAKNMGNLSRVSLEFTMLVKGEPKITSKDLALDRK